MATSAGGRAAAAPIFEYVDVFYNRQRLHSSTGGDWVAA
jgi:hypothetical protein